MQTFLLASKRQQITARWRKSGGVVLADDLESGRCRGLSVIERRLTPKELTDLMRVINQYSYGLPWRRSVIVRRLADRRVERWMRDLLLLVGTNFGKSDRDILLSQIPLLEEGEDVN